MFKKKHFVLALVALFSCLILARLVLEKGQTSKTISVCWVKLRILYQLNNSQFKWYIFIYIYIIYYFKKNTYQFLPSHPCPIPRRPSACPRAISWQPRRRQLARQWFSRKRLGTSWRSTGLATIITISPIIHQIAPILGDLKWIDHCKSMYPISNHDFKEGIWMIDRSQIECLIIWG